jgi:hypothetical protein
LATLARLEKKHVIKGLKIPQYLKELKKNWPRLVLKYIRSKSLKDVLFRGDYNHVKSSVIRDTGTSGSKAEGKEEKNKKDKDKEKKVVILTVIGLKLSAENPGICVFITAWSHPAIK